MNEYHFLCVILFLGRPNSPNITVIFNKIKGPYQITENENKRNGCKISVKVTHDIKMTASVSCTKPTVSLVWTGPGDFNNKKPILCEDNSTFTSESELSINSATEDQTGLMVSLQVSHPLLTETYIYHLEVNGRYMMLQAILKEVLR